MCVEKISRKIVNTENDAKLRAEIKEGGENRWGSGRAFGILMVGLKVDDDEKKWRTEPKEGA